MAANQSLVARHRLVVSRQLAKARLPRKAAPKQSKKPDKPAPEIRQPVHRQIVRPGAVPAQPVQALAATQIRPSLCITPPISARHRASCHWHRHLASIYLIPGRPKPASTPYLAACKPLSGSAISITPLSVALAQRQAIPCHNSNQTSTRWRMTLKYTASICLTNRTRVFARALPAT